MPQRLMAHGDTDPRQKIWDEIGDLAEVEVTGSQVLCAIYQRPKRTASGIYLTDRNLDEDVFQGKVGMLVKAGPQAFDDVADQRFGAMRAGGDQPAEPGDWLFFRPSDGFSLSVNGVPCRLLSDEDIRGRIAHPDAVW